MFYVPLCHTVFHDMLSLAVQHRRSLSELEWSPEPCAGPPHRSASALPAPRAPPRLARLHRLAHIMLLRDPPRGRPTTPLDTFRGVNKILEPGHSRAGGSVRFFFFNRLFSLLGRTCPPNHPQEWEHRATYWVPHNGHRRQSGDGRMTSTRN